MNFFAPIKFYNLYTIRLQQLVHVNRSIFVVLLSLVASGCSERDLEPTAPAAVRPVKLITVELASSTESRTYPAVIEAEIVRVLSFQVAGLIEQLPIHESLKINKGAVLAELDSRDFLSRLKSAQSQHNNAKEAYHRALRLAQQDAIAQSTVEQRLSQYEMSQADLETANKALEDTVLRSPIEGVVSQLTVEELQNVQAGSPIVTIIGNGSMLAVVNVPARLVARFNQRKDITAHVTLASLPAVKLPAVYCEASLDADASSQTFRVAFRFDRTEQVIILPGMTASLTVSSSSRSADGNAIAVPLAAILSEADSNYIWLLDESSMTVSRRVVDVGAGIGEKLQINAGLNAGDIIVGAGANYLAEGMKVRAWTAQ